MQNITPVEVAIAEHEANMISLLDMVDAIEVEDAADAHEVSELMAQIDIEREAIDGLSFFLNLLDMVSA